MNPAETTASHPLVVRARWRLELRRAEGGPWVAVERAGSAGPLHDAAAAPAFAWGPGDLVAVRDPRGARRALWVCAPDGPREAGPLPEALRACGSDWVGAWESERADALAMMRAAERADRRRFARVAAACAARVVGGLSPQECRAALDLLDLVRGWAEGEAGADAGAVARAGAQFVDPPWTSGVGYADRAHGPARDAVYQAKRSALADDHEGAFRAALGCVSSCGEIVDDDRLFAPTVRAHLPLPVALLARARAPTPPALVL